ncbi:MAG: peptide-methionine (R)-S-oxide reductase MsrB [Gemmatimonadota bacterium]|nr:peptide-methionine (R)-S-oxide reductase MsrB [Gemmatimonadota bacterium]
MDGDTQADKVERSDEEWRRRLTPAAYHVTRQRGTEPPFSGRYRDSKEEGTYVCVGCGNELFGSDAKYDSGTGWPSYTAPIAPERVRSRPDDSLLVRRTEVLCARCDAHLGHVFEDGPGPSRMRYCINSVALDLKPTAEE